MAFYFRKRSTLRLPLTLSVTLMALNVTLMSYCETCYVAVNIDTGAVPDPDVLMGCLRDGFDEVLAVGGGTGRAVLPSAAPV